MRGLQLTLLAEDYNLLMDHLLSEDISDYNRRQLYQELKNARIVSKDCLPLNVVCRNAKVVVWNMNKNQTFSVQLVLQEEECDRKENKIPATDPLAIALMGYPSGATIEWEIDKRINVFKIISVNQIDNNTVYAC